MKRSLQLRSGFTIIELLISIVIIAILAAIIIVAYNGVRERAQKALIASTIRNYGAAIKVQYSSTGTWPLASSAVNSACIGSSASYASTYAFLTPGICSTLPDVSTNAEFNTTMAPYIGNPPNLDFIQPIQFTPTSKYARGVYYIVTCLPNFCTLASTPSHEQHVYLSYRIPASQTCAIGQALPDTPAPGFTDCMYIVNQGAT